MAGRATVGTPGLSDSAGNAWAAPAPSPEI
jgi:hypothetical protein